MFISFEGIDGSGKSTQLALLREWFEQRGHTVVALREPGATVLSEDIRTIVLSNKQNITPMAELLLFSAARVQLVEKVIRPALEQQSVVLCDRYVDSTTAYQGSGRELNMEYVALCNRLATGGVMPDVTFFIDVPYEEAQLRMNFHSAHAEPDRMEKSGRVFFERVRLGYLTIARSEPHRVVVLDGMQSREIIHEHIISHVRGRLSALNR